MKLGNGVYLTTCHKFNEGMGARGYQDPKTSSLGIRSGNYWQEELLGCQEALPHGTFPSLGELEHQFSFSRAVNLFRFAL